MALIYLHCFLRLSDLSLFPLSSLSASKAEWPTEEEEKEEKEEGEPKRRRREFHARCSRCRRYRRRRRRRSAQFTVSDADDARLAAQREQPSFLFWRACKAARVGENNGGGRFADFMDCVSLSVYRAGSRARDSFSCRHFHLLRSSGGQNYNYPISFEPPFLPPMNKQPWRTRPRYLRQ